MELNSSKKDVNTPHKVAEKEDEVQIISDDKESDEDDVEVGLEYKRYVTKNSFQDENKLKALKSINSFLGLPSTQVFDDDSLLTGANLLNWLKEWFPDRDSEFLKGISESQAVRNCQASLADLYNSIAIRCSLNRYIGPYQFEVTHMLKMESLQFFHTSAVD